MIFRIPLFLFIIASSFLVSSCGSEDGECSYFSQECPEPTILPTCDSNEPGIVDGCGEAINTVDIHDPVHINLQGLSVNEQHSLTILNPDGTDIATLGGEYAAGSIASTSDQDGAIYLSTIVQNMPNNAVLGSYTVNVTDSSNAIVQTWNYNVEGRDRIRCTDSADAITANPKASFTSAENVYAVVESTLNDGAYNLYVLSDSQTAIPNNGLIPGTANSITLAGGAGGIDLGTFTQGAYDLLLDVNRNGRYNRDTDLISRQARLHPCFAVQAVNSGASMAEQIAADRNGNKREIFDPDANKTAVRDVFANLTPTERSADTTPGTSDIYVVAHQDTWTNGTVLTDVTGTTPDEPNSGPVQNGANSQGNIMQWSFSNLSAGCYDIVVDTNRDGVYTINQDYVDNTNHLGDNTDCGLRVSTPDSTNVTITSHSDNQVVPFTAITLEGDITVSASPLAGAFIRITTGTQSNIIGLNEVVALGGGGYSANIPLYSGSNHITVSGVYNNNTSMSETITVRSVTDLALFRAQLTWDGSTDMDLHLVRPGGSYSNGGGGEDDCNWENCKIDGTGIYSINWGNESSDADDPKLDVDCVACGNGIENIWMNEINDDGVYRVYVDAFSGSETDSDVYVTISILGSTVGQVNCGNMVADSATDTCYVGDITWTGGTSGAGSFTPVGTLANDFRPAGQPAPRSKPVKR